LSFTLRSLKRHQPLQEQVYQALRTAILSGELVAGARLVETQLATKLQVSRTPIREALRLLQHDNLVEVGESGTLRIAILSQEDAAQLYDCRIALEQQAVLEACRNVAPAQLAELESMLLKAEKLYNAEPTQLTNFRMLDLDYQFHRLIAQSSGNYWLTSLLDQVFDKMQLLRLQTMRHNPRVLEIRLEHRQVYEALVQRDADAARYAIKSHLVASKARVSQEIEQLKDIQMAQSSAVSLL
jgi:DNA-binding GntR family transcriptional regulator